jgi:hypothetical protein
MLTERNREVAQVKARMLFPLTTRAPAPQPAPRGGSI